jgi:hypothetical protein
MIEVVQDYVKIVRSHAILSFHFLKNLRLIGGQRLYDIKYVLIVIILVSFMIFFGMACCALLFVNTIVAEYPVGRIFKSLLLLLMSYAVEAIMFSV